MKAIRGKSLDFQCVRQPSHSVRLARLSGLARLWSNLVKYQEKRLSVLPPQAVQEGNRNWWTAHTMSYDWKDKSGLVQFSQPWFDDIDRRFLHAARLYT